MTAVHQLYLCLGKGCVGRNQARVDELVSGVVVALLATVDVAQLLRRDGEALLSAQRDAEPVRARLDFAADDYADVSRTRPGEPLAPLRRP